MISRAQPDPTPVHRSKTGTVISALILVAISVRVFVSDGTGWRLGFFGVIIATVLVLRIVEHRHSAFVDSGTPGVRWLVADRVLRWAAPKLTIAAVAVAIVVLAGAVLFGPSCPGPN